MRNWVLRYRRTIAFVLLLLFGVAKWPIEARLEAERKAAHVNVSHFSLSLRQQLSQSSFLAAVGGFRALVADYCYLDAHAEWSRVEWGRMKVNFDACTALMPRCILFWDQASWHMAFNASVAAYENKEKEPNNALRLKAQRDYWKLGEDYLIRGIVNNPDVPTLYDHLGFLYREKFKDHAKAAELYKECAQLPDAPSYARRFHYYELAQCPGHEREAYEGLLRLYKEGEQERLPTLLKWLGNLQEKLNVPADQKIYIPPAANP
jgi:hypothetical protein